MSKTRNQALERDDAPLWAEPFGALFWKLRFQGWLLGFAVFALLVMGTQLYLLATRASAHVYEVHPDGKAVYIGDRISHLAPRPDEATFVAKLFVELLYGWNSSTVAQDLTSALSLCGEPLLGQLRGELAQARFIDAVRARQVRSEVAFTSVDLVSEGHTQFRLTVHARVLLFPLTQYSGEPSEEKSVDLELVLSAVPRDPERTPNGLEVVRLVQALKKEIPNK